jgi:hypothetical protein
MAVRLLRLTRVAPCSGTTCGTAASLVLVRGIAHASCFVFMLFLVGCGESVLLTVLRSSDEGAWLFQSGWYSALLSVPSWILMS